jgi:hypothetical protein
MSVAQMLVEAEVLQGPIVQQGLMLQEADISTQVVCQALRRTLPKIASLI